MPTPHTQLVSLLADVDGIIVETKSHIEKPESNESQLRACMVLEDVEEAKRAVERELGEQ
jgi:hypothetical protein